MWKLWGKHESINRRWAFGALAAYIVMLVVNAVGGSTTWLGGVNTAAVSDAYPNLFAPAGFTFAIWGVIYLALGLFFFRVFGIAKTGKQRVSASKLNRVIRLFTLTSIVNALWMFAWQYKQLTLSVLLMVALLVLLAKINICLRSQQLTPQEHSLVRVPFSIYFGWISVATIANITTWLVSAQWGGFGVREGIWMVAVLLVGAVIGVVAAVRQRDWAYMAVFVWAYAGILVKHLSPGGHNGAYPSTIITLQILLPLLITAVTLIALRWPFGPHSKRVLD